ncbi:MAG: winged helix DNA-binding domain-containing protein [Bacteroidales bacterium]|jgi:hypothetical protein|nr:winged helix DNA-binding domain-containing protein [Bacteroidales bacterium]
MNTSELLKIRLHNQLLADHVINEPHKIVSWFGAMQSQSLEMAKWAIGSRLEGSTVSTIENALNTGKIIRTHILRPTWHFVAAEDIHWMFELSNPRIKPVYISYCRMIGVEETIIYKSIDILEKALTGNKHLTKEEISEILLHKNIKTDNHLLNMIIGRAEMEGIICNGKLRGNKQTYTLLQEWVPEKNKLSKEEALECLARKFFSSHSPATLQDFVWWSGLTVTEARKAIELIKNDFISEEINGRIFWMKNNISVPDKTEISALLLPPFDEFVVSYKDRSEIIEDQHYSKVMTKNGLFSPTIMLNGQIIGSWKKINTKNGIKIELSFFEKTNIKTQSLFKKEIKRLEAFYNNSSI